MITDTQHIPLSAGEHAVHFYEGDDDLCRTVGAYLASGLQTGAAALVVATEPHSRAFVAELDAVAVDWAARFVLLDAASTLAELMPDGRLDRDTFRRVIGAAVREAGGDGRPVCAYGEMVALLWAASDIESAIELEQLWNELGRELEFSLLCAYPSSDVSDSEHTHELAEVCRLHSSVIVPTPRAAVASRFEPTPDAPRAARVFVTDALRELGYNGSLLDDAMIVISELATNAVVHVGSRFEVVVEPLAYGARVTVSDDAHRAPAMRDSNPLATSGHGLHVITAVASAWGVEPTVGGKAVWAELRG